MSKANLVEAFELIEANKELSDFEKDSKSEYLIKQAEEALEICFPPSYRAFLERYGCGDIAGVEIYGLIDNNFTDSAIPNGIWTTLNARKKWQLPHHFIVISSTGDGFWYALDSSKVNAEGEYPVVICGFGENNEGSQKVNEDFGEFLLEQIQQSLDLE